MTMDNTHVREKKPFQSAGVLPLRLHPVTQQVECLLAWEENYGTRRCRFYEQRPEGCRENAACEYLHLVGPTVNANEKEMLRLNFLGGKREPGEEDSTLTAAREFSEETHGLVSLEEALRWTTLAKHVFQPIRLCGAYDLYILWLPPMHAQVIAETYARLERDPPLACAYALYWVPLASLLQVDDEQDAGYVIHVPGFGYRPISNLLWSCCVRQAAILTRMQQRCFDIA